MVDMDAVAESILEVLALERGVVADDCKMYMLFSPGPHHVPPTSSFYYSSTDHARCWQIVASRLAGKFSARRSRHPLPRARRLREPDRAPSVHPTLVRLE